MSCQSYSSCILQEYFHRRGLTSAAILSILTIFIQVIIATRLSLGGHYLADGNATMDAGAYNNRDMTCCCMQGALQERHLAAIPAASALRQRPLPPPH